ncbi:hypothetical protein GOV05_01945 [Candidatus Woesearchaeota archaeon]|nr:hypothetical protein [Candidatus Woesearchaeota archaeon]
MVTYINVDEKIVDELVELGFARIEKKTEHETARLQSMSPKATAILYNTKKLLIQASDAIEKDLVKKLSVLGYEPETKKEIKQKTLRGLVVGSDETLKGDTFGGLVVAAVMCDDKTRLKLQRLGVTDSKKIKDEDIKNWASHIKEIVGDAHVVISVLPLEYNKHEQTTLMNKLHREVFEYLAKHKTGITHVVDKYPGCKVGDVAETKAESKYVEVAAASILAREAGLKQLYDLSYELGIEIPKGSTHVKQALDYLKKSGKNPKGFVKLHFGNVKNVFGKI